MIRYLLMFLLITIYINTASGEVIIGNTSEKDLSIEKIKMIYLGKIGRWDNGKRIILATLEKGETHETFMENCLNKKSKSFILYWKQRMFTGRGIMPKSFKNENELIEFVKNTDGAIGYISDRLKDTLPKEITVLKICEQKE